MSELEYKELDLYQHVLHRPDMYIGSIYPQQVKEYIVEEGKIFSKEISIIHGLLKLFNEALSNAIDNIWRSKEKGVECKNIKITIQSNQCSIYNDGLSIPIRVVSSQGEEIYLPEMLFGRLLTSSNFNDEEKRETIGRNGVGISLCNIFSSWFRITIHNDGKSYQQTWQNHMKEKEKPIIKSAKGKTPSVLVEWRPDFTYFQQTEFHRDELALLHRYVYDVAMLAEGVSVWLNGKKMGNKTLKEYAKLFIPPSASCELLYIETPESKMVLLGSQEKSDRKGLSFVNGHCTTEGGEHLIAWKNAVYKALIPKLNAKLKTKLNVKELKPFFTFFVVATLKNPQFTSQSKTFLSAPKYSTSPVLDEKQVSTLMKWNFVQTLRASIEEKEMISLKKTEKKKYVKLEGLDPSNKSGVDCSLILCEGLSAKAFAVQGIQEGVSFGKVNRKGRDYFGIYPLRGKLLNCRNASISTIKNNKEITGVIQALGLRYTMDYTLEENYKTLRYGRILILVDSDGDGIHIQGLLLNFLDSLFPSLLERGDFIWSMKTPVIKIGENLRFYHLQEAREYIAKHSPKKEIKYYKGLGTSSNQDIKATFGKYVVKYHLDEQAREHLEMVFGKKHADKRKEWLKTPLTNDYTSSTLQNISQFIHQELIQFSLEDCKRNIPYMMDGLKESQRKILFACFLKKLTFEKQSFKVAQLAGFVAEKTLYHHGETCLFETIIGMGQSFVGSNNIPLLYGDGQFGTRLALGDSANARYIFTKLSPLTPFIFSEQDIIQGQIEEGVSIEPEYYIPIVPMLLVNGVSAAIGTGWSCSIPKFNIVDIIQCIRDWLEQRPFTEIHPWYQGFTGKMLKINDLKYETRGTMEREQNKIIVRELPIGMWTENFKEYLEDLLEEKKIRKLINNSTPEKIYFEFQLLDENILEPLQEKLKTTLSLNNMVLFNSQGIIQKYSTLEEILYEFCAIRWKQYTLRRQHLLSTLEKEYTDWEEKYRFLRCIVQGELDITMKKEEEIKEKMKKLGFPEEKSRDLLQIPLRNLTEQKMKEWKEKVENYKREWEECKKTDEKKMWLKDLRQLEEHF